MDIPIMHLTAEPKNVAATENKTAENIVSLCPRIRPLIFAETAEELERISLICRSDVLVSETRVERGAGISRGLPAFNVNFA